MNGYVQLFENFGQFELRCSRVVRLILKELYFNSNFWENKQYLWTV